MNNNNKNVMQLASVDVVYGERDPSTMHPDLTWLKACLEGDYGPPPKLVVITNPCNPTGTILDRYEAQLAVEMCARAGVWLVFDNTYEHFVYDPDLSPHYCATGPHVIHLFSMSKAFGMMGWRVGYIAFHRADTQLYQQLLKVQDTVPIAACTASQRLALGALAAGRGWVEARVEELVNSNRRAVREALDVLGDAGVQVFGGDGAIYYWAALPSGCEDDVAVCRYLVDQFGVCVVPGSACGVPGHIRVAYANLDPDTCSTAAARLRKGLEALMGGGGGGAGGASGRREGRGREGEGGGEWEREDLDLAGETVSSGR